MNLGANFFYPHQDSNRKTCPMNRGYFLFLSLPESCLIHQSKKRTAGETLTPDLHQNTRTSATAATLSMLVPAISLAQTFSSTVVPCHAVATAPSTAAARTDSICTSSTVACQYQPLRHRSLERIRHQRLATL